MTGMSDDRGDALARYVDAAADVTGLTLSAQRLQAVAEVMTRVAAFALDLGAFELADDVEVAGVFTP
jgi:hypothetical protein